MILVYLNGLYGHLNEIETTWKPYIYIFGIVNDLCIAIFVLLSQPSLINLYV